MYGRGDYLVKFFNNKKQKQISSCKAISQFFCFGSFFFSQKKKHSIQERDEFLKEKIPFITDSFLLKTSTPDILILKN